MKKLITLSVFLLLSHMLSAADFRTWTSLSGSNLEAQLVKLDGEVAVLATKEPKEIRIKGSELSLADRQYLIEFAKADPALLFRDKITIPEEEIKLPNDFLKKLETKIKFSTDSQLIFDVWESPHFIYATQGRARIKGLAHTAEACWHGMAFQHMEFRDNWADKKYLIVIPENEEVYKAMGEYEYKYLVEIAQQKFAESIKSTWDRVGSSHVNASEADMSTYNLMEGGLIFHVREDTKFDDKFSPFQTHCLSSALYNFQIGGISQVSGPGYFALSTGHAYYKEIQLASKTETNMLSKESGGEIATKSGFEDGRSWARTLRSLVKKDKVKTNLEKMLEMDAAQLDPERLVLMYSFSAYMQSTPARLANYAKLTRLIHTSNQIPEQSEIALIFGFDTVEAFEKDWKDYIESNDFK